MTTDHTHDPSPAAASGNVEERVLKVIATTKRLPLDSVTLDSSFESLGIDSLDRLNILFDLESEFDIQINDEDARQVENIRQMVAGVQELLQATASSPVHSQPAATSIAQPSSTAGQLTEIQAEAAEQSTAQADPMAAKLASSEE